MRPSISPTITIAFLLLFLLHQTAAARSTATSFCKCICFNNSTIIALNPPSSKASNHRLEIRSPPLEGVASTLESREEAGKTPANPHRKLSCADCTRAFCLDYNLPICKDAGVEDVFTTCFQRDSLKDETVVVIFIFATAGLLAWALVKPWVDRLRLRNERRDFAPLVGSESNEGPHTPSGHTQAPARGGGNGNGRGGGRRGASTRFVDADEDAVDIGSGSTAGVVH